MLKRLLNPVNKAALNILNLIVYYIFDAIINALYIFTILPEVEILLNEAVFDGSPPNTTGVLVDNPLSINTCFTCLAESFG